MKRTVKQRKKSCWSFVKRVKHNHRDAILDVIEISYDEFKIGQAAHRENAYFNCSSKWEQNLIINEISDNIHRETGLGKKERKNNLDRLSKLEVLRRYNRKTNKYSQCYLGA